MTVHYQGNGVTLHHGDCLDVLRTLPDNSVDSVVTDPPYGLGFMGKEWDTVKQDASRPPSADETDARFNNKFPRTGKGPAAVAFDGAAFQQWCELWAAECLRVLKPGGHLLAAGGSRTYHRMTCGVEDAGFEIRDCITWHFGSGFPKSLNVSAALDRTVPADARCVCGPRSTETPQGSPVGYPSSHGFDGGQPHPAAADGPASPQPLGDAPAHTRDGQPRDGLDAAPANSGPGAESGHPSTADSPHRSELLSACDRSDASAPSDTRTNTSAAPVSEPRRTPDHTPRTSGLAAGSASDSSWRNKYMACPDCGGVAIPQGLGTALKPATEFFVVARKPLGERTVAANVTTHGTGALNIDASRIEGEVPSTTHGVSGGDHIGQLKGRPLSEFTPHASGRWPANVILDEDMAGVLDEQSGTLTSGKMKPTHTTAGVDGRASAYGKDAAGGFTTMETYGDSGGASRFFYVAKAPKRERPVVDGVAHPTVKPLALMRWLVRLVTPPGGVVLEPFAGSGTTVEACLLEGFRCVAIEKGDEYLPLILERIRRQTEPPEVAELVRTVDPAAAIVEQVDGQLDIFGEATA